MIVKEGIHARMGPFRLLINIYDLSAGSVIVARYQELETLSHQWALDMHCYE